MTTTLYKSALSPDFESRVEAFRQKLLKHRFTIDEPAPIEQDVIENCIKRVQYPISAKRPDDFIKDYVIIDDTPPPPPPLTLKEKKDKLHFAILEQEGAYCNSILPPGKVRLYSIRYQDLMTLKTAELFKGAEFAPPEADKAFMAEYEQIVSRLDKTHRDVAHVLSEIEDLTEDNIDNWILPVLS